MGLKGTLRPYSAGTFFTIIGLLACCIADGFLTDILITCGAREANPVMLFLMELGMIPFLIGKYALTVAGLCFLLILRNRPLFGGFVRANDLLPMLQLFYTVLLIYEAFLLSVVVLGG